MTPKQRREARALLIWHLINAAKAGMETALEYPDDARELIEADYDAVAAAFVPILLSKIDALLDELQAQKVTP